MMTSLKTAGLLLLSLVVSVNLAVARGQANPAGAISGQVLDRAGSAVANVRVVATNLQTGASQETTTDGRGRYSFESLPEGAYNLRFEATGARPLTREEVRVGAD